MSLLTAVAALAGCADYYQANDRQVAAFNQSHPPVVNQAIDPGGVPAVNIAPDVAFSGPAPGFSGTRPGFSGTQPGPLFADAVGLTVINTLRPSDIFIARDAEAEALTAPAGTPIDWNNPETGNFGRVTVLRDGQDEMTGDTCRELETLATINGQEFANIGAACQNPDGSWELVS